MKASGELPKIPSKGRLSEGVGAAADAGVRTDRDVKPFRLAELSSRPAVLRRAQRRPIPEEGGPRRPAWPRKGGGSA